MPMTGVVRPCQRPIGDPGVYKVLGSWEWFEDPGSSIPPEITTITGITDEMVAGHRIDDHAVYDLLSRVVLVIAHHADFDRRFLEKRNIGRAAVSRLTGKPRASGHQRSNLSPTRWGSSMTAIGRRVIVGPPFTPWLNGSPAQGAGIAGPPGNREIADVALMGERCGDREEASPEGPRLLMEPRRFWATQMLVSRRFGCR
jgi:hypothetical protein